MDDFKRKTKGEDAGSARTGVIISSADSTQLLHVITALNLIRMNLGMYPHGHSRITESVDHAFDMIKKILLEKAELFVGFAGDTVTFGETAPDREKKNPAFRDYAGCLNNLRIVSFTLHSGLKKEDLLEFNRILTARPSDVWASGKIETVFSRVGITGIKIKVIDADHFRLVEEKAVGVDQKKKDEHFWQDFFAGQTSKSSERNQDGSIPDIGKTDSAEAIRFLNMEREHWSSAVLSYEKMIRDNFSKLPKETRIRNKNLETLTGVNSLVSDLHPELKKQLIDVVERQFTTHPETALVEENLKCFPDDIFMEIIRRTSERGSQISPTLVNLLKKMACIQDTPVSYDRLKEKDFSTGDMETLLKREKYESYVPEDYDRILKKAAEAFSSDEDIDESQFPLHEYLKTLAYEYIDFQICRLIHSFMDEEITEEEYLTCSRKLERSIPELLKGEQFAFLTTVMGILRRHTNEKPTENVRQKALLLLKSLSEKETVARHVAPVILKGTGEPASLTTFLISGGVQNLSWLFDMYLDPKTPLSITITEIMKGFGRNATEEALKRLSDRNPYTIIRLLTLIREMNDRSVASSLRNLFNHEDWTVRREVINTLIQFDDPAVIDMLRKSLKAKDQDEVFEAVGLSCRYRVGDLLKDLMSMIKIFIIREENAILNEWIAGELAKTGHPSVIPHLERIAGKWLSFSPKHLSRMKLMLYRNLRHFQKNDIIKLLEIGNRSRNKEISAISAKILKSRE